MQLFCKLCKKVTEHWDMREHFDTRVNWNYGKCNQCGEYNPIVVEDK